MPGAAEAPVNVVHLQDGRQPVAEVVRLGILRGDHELPGPVDEPGPALVRVAGVADAHQGEAVVELLAVAIHAERRLGFKLKSQLAFGIQIRNSQNTHLLTDWNRNTQRLACGRFCRR